MTCGAGGHCDLLLVEQTDTVVIRYGVKRMKRAVSPAAFRWTAQSISNIEE